MEFFEWGVEFETGIPEIDAQHKKMIGYANDLISRIGSGDTKEILQKLLSKLVEYTQEHFTLEEKAFYRYQYFETERHKKEHAIFIAKIHEIQKELENDQVLISNKLATFLVDWVRNHILYEDMKYVNSLRGKSFKFL